MQKNKIIALVAVICFMISQIPTCVLGEENVENKEVYNQEYLDEMVSTLNGVGIIEYNSLSEPYKTANKKMFYTIYNSFAADGNFGEKGASAALTFGDCIKPVLDLIGYKTVILADGGTDSAYFAKAARLKVIPEGIDSMAATLTRAQLIEFLYKILDTDVLKVTEIAGDGIVYKKNDETFLSYVMGIEKCEGLVTHNEFTSLYSSTGAGLGRIGIDEVMYRCKKRFNDYLGFNVTFYKEKDTQNAEILYVKDNNTKYKRIDLENISEFNQNGIKYYDDKNRSKSEKFTNLKLIYNGICVTGQQFDPAVFNVKNGYVEIIKSEVSNGYDTVKIFDCKTSMVKSYDDNTNVLFDTDNNYYDIAEKDTSSVRNSKGEYIDFSEFKKDVVISVAESLDKSHIEFIVSDIPSVNGEITALKNDGLGLHITVGEYEYITINGYDAQKYPVNIGSYATLYFDYCGRVLAAKTHEVNTESFGYMVKSGFDNSLNDILKVIIYTSAKDLETFECAKYVKLDGKGYSDSKKLYEALNRVEGNGRGLVIYTLDKENKINFINSAEVGDRESPDSFRIMLGSQVREISDNRVKIDSTKLNNSYRWYNFTSNYSVFKVPKNDEDLLNEKMYDCGKISGIEDTILYTTGELGSLPVAAVQKHSKIADDYFGNSPVLNVFRKKSIVLDENKEVPVIKISAINQAGNESNFYVDPKNEDVIAELDEGDIFSVILDISGKINKVVKWVDASEENKLLYNKNNTFFTDRNKTAYDTNPAGATVDFFNYSYGKVSVDYGIALTKDTETNNLLLLYKGNIGIASDINSSNFFNYEDCVFPIKLISSSPVIVCTKDSRDTWSVEKTNLSKVKDYTLYGDNASEIVSIMASGIQKAVVVYNIED